MEASASFPCHRKTEGVSRVQNQALWAEADRAEGGGGREDACEEVSSQKSKRESGRSPLSPSPSSSAFSSTQRGPQKWHFNSGVAGTQLLTSPSLCFSLSLSSSHRPLRWKRLTLFSLLSGLPYIMSSSHGHLPLWFCLKNNLYTTNYNMK